MENEVDNYRDDPYQDTEQPQKVKTGLWRFLIDVIETIVLSVLLFLGINAVTARIRVEGFSMEPTMHNGEFVLVNRLAYRFGAPSLGDVIVFHFPIDPEQEYIKRVIGLPGDHIVIGNQQVAVNDRVLVEPYVAAWPDYQGDWIVPEEHLFVLGDNRNNSSDSHSWGPVPMANVVGKAVFVYWPLSDVGLIEHVEPVLLTP
ncbi:MAG: signal peptidase I [Anaerolineales bacterium]|nr:MAG: signal peptidase I [Anaerolineales bacterium]